LSWQKKLAEGFKSAADLLEFLELPISVGHELAELQFVSRIPLGFAQKMQKGNPNDPLLLQVLATKSELIDAKDYMHDPLQEAQSNVMPGLLHKYHGRVLITLTSACAINCRYCFRRHFPYQANNPGKAGRQAICDAIAADPSITEVILSGGDPLLNSDKVLADLLQQLDAIPHVHTVRIHTRIPVVLPERIDTGFKDVLAASRLHKVIVLHCNHAQELDTLVHNACNALRQMGCHLLNQSVLLKGINDDVVTLISLSQALFACGVLPYYLHVLDKVQGTAHFDMPRACAQKLYGQLQTRLPGYLLPRLATEEPGALSKTLLGSS
jgi:L-lysine 2,3-aminomutase